MDVKILNQYILKKNNNENGLKKQKKKIANKNGSKHNM